MKLCACSKRDGFFFFFFLDIDISVQLCSFSTNISRKQSEAVYQLLYCGYCNHLEKTTFSISTYRVSYERCKSMFFAIVLPTLQ